MAAVTLCGCEQSVSKAAVETSTAKASALHCGRGGFIRGRVVGAVSVDIDWDAESVSCDGMPRPNGQGARLRFAGKSDELDQTAAIIIALPELARGETGTDLDSNVTFVVEGSGRFFSTADTDICWADVARQEALSDDRYAVGGNLYCIGPLVEVNGNSSVSIPELEFSGLLDWSSK